MKETAVQVNERKIRNGLRKQRKAVESEQQKVWDRLTDAGGPRMLRGIWISEVSADLESMHSNELEQELTDILAAEMHKELK
jgi:hypothetical protein